MSMGSLAGLRQRPGADELVECEVWSAAPSDHPGLLRFLGPEDRRRADRLRRAEDRSAFVTAHALLRVLLAARTGVPPAELRFQARCRMCGGPHGKPRLVPPEGVRPVSFSLSHTDGRVAIALTNDADVGVGVDVERVRHLGEAEVTALSASILSQPELAQFAGLDRHERRWALAVWWARKEALLKASGHGLAVPMSDVVVSSPDRAAEVRSICTAPETPVSLQDLSPGPEHAASIAVLGTARLSVVEPDAEELLSRAHRPSGWWV